MKFLKIYPIIVALALSVLVVGAWATSIREHRPNSTNTAITTTPTVGTEKEYSLVGVWKTLNLAMLDAGVIYHQYYAFTSDGNVVSVIHTGTVESGMVWMSWYDYKWVDNGIVSEGTWKKEGVDYSFYNPENDTQTKIKFDEEDRLHFDPEVSKDKFGVYYHRVDENSIPWSEIKINCIDATGKEMDFTLADVWSQV